MPAPRPRPEKTSAKKLNGAAAPRKKSAAIMSPKLVQQRADQAVQALKQEYPDAECALVHRSPFQLLVATILSAQCTDERVNIVTKDLFKKYRGPQDFAAAPLPEIEQAIQSTGFFRNKAKSIRTLAAQLVALHAGEVPRRIEELVGLSGVARKTANVVLGTAYGIGEGFVVDTHVTRVAQRLALTQHTEPVRIEQDLCRTFPQPSWIELGHRLVLHGRYTCLARTPLCAECPLQELCPSRQAEPVRPWQARAQDEAARLARALASS
jgi:endonuclease-3